MLPNIANTLLSWEVSCILRKITQQLVTTTNLDGSFTEDNTYINTDYNILAVIQPLKPTELQIKPAEQRAWDWYQVHVRANLQAGDVNDRMIYNGIIYKIMLQNNYLPYGYIEYHVIKDFV